jgi:transcriptional regulator of acetoin/glycerol metabolism
MRHTPESWSRFISQLQYDDAGERPYILKSWQRSRAAGVNPAPSSVLLSRVEGGEFGGAVREKTDFCERGSTAYGYVLGITCHTPACALYHR